VSATAIGSVLTWLSRLAAIAVLTGFGLAIWFAGPMIRYGDARPFTSEWIRAVVIAGAVVLAISRAVLHEWRARRAQKKIEHAMAPSEADGSDAELLEARMREAVATLKQRGAGRNFLYELPWYVIIGPPGAGKTTALVNSGLRFLPVTGGEAAVGGGVGGTRNCDWWFTGEAVLIDTAGRYTTQDSDARADRKSWLAFLAILKRYRPRRPVNGAILAVSLSDLMALDGNELGAHAAAIRKRLDEIDDALRIDCPVYVLFTKADLIAGFREYFADFDEARRQMVWGTTFDPMPSAGDLRGNVIDGFKALAARLSAETADRIEEEADPLARRAIFGFPAQFGLLGERVGDYVAAIFDTPDRQLPAKLRGFYLSSGTQEGTPIDQFLGAVGRDFGVGTAGCMSGIGKSFFLHDLLARVIFPEATLISYDRAAERRAAIGRIAFIGIAGIVLVGMIGAIGLGFRVNGRMIGATRLALDRYHVAAAPLLSKSVDKPDLENVALPLEMLRDLPVGYASRGATVPWQAGLGLGQRDALLSASEEAYRQGLERMLRPRLLLQLEDVIHKEMGDPIRLYEPLKVYLMLAGAAPKTDNGLILSWLTNDWKRNRFSGPDNRQGRLELEAHVRAMLALDEARDPLYRPDAALVAAARHSLGRLSLADRAQAILQAGLGREPIPPFSFGMRAGPQGERVFAAVDGADIGQITVSGLYTHDGFNRHYLPKLAKVAQSLSDDRWAFGEGGGDSDANADLTGLGSDLLDRYAADFSAAWNQALARLRFQPLASGKPQYPSLAAAASTGSPIRQLFQAIAEATTLAGGGDPDTSGSAGNTEPGTPDDISNRELESGLARIGITLSARKSQSRAGAAPAASGDVLPGAAIDARFRPFRLLVNGRPGERPIDALIRNFHDIYQSLRAEAAGTEEGRQADASLPLKLQSLRLNATRLPKVLANLVLAAADQFEGNAAETSLDALNATLARLVTMPCRQMLDDRYPFTPGTSNEVSLKDFARLFAPGGIIDGYFARNLAPLVDMSSQGWEWRRGTRRGRGLSETTLRQFRMAAEIRDAFFRQGETMPAIRITIAPASLNADVDMALLSIDGQIVTSYQSGGSASTVKWPGNGSPSANLSFTPSMPGRQSVLGFQGRWALRRLLQAGTLTPNGDDVDARFVIGGRDASFTIRTDPRPDPFLLPALSEFSCPSGF
jgi:type VI secretion system protein ImpL